MNYRTAINDLSLKGYLYARQLLPFLMIGLALLCLMPDSCFAAENRLSGLKEEVKATFGADSDLPYFLLLAEGLAGAYAYIKTKNIAVLAGVPVLMVFTHWALK
ncbi:MULTISPECIES: type IV conjugative transfer system pilin TraA [Legionella]|jgi:type IV conjugative transfer system pilin TraA|uniref:type IV conjugative transfer system pilin TraA n=1 Tax=Legionella TaxID=445 RepID=UPI00095B23E6|nr:MULTISPECIES: type IV conjugative transfer system pilin TraA [Legionella]MBN9228052.1 conjugal transfer protein TraA [Legionella steelei]OJW06082.1 MAG: conjugal transfer protein TraA [Legionella sp. 39-23]